MIKKQRRLIIISLIVIVLLAALYFVVISPLVNKPEEFDPEPTVGFELYADSKNTYFAVVEENGEKKYYLYDIERRELTDKEYEAPEDVSYQQFMFPPMEKENVVEITIHNKDSDYGFYKADDGEFYMTDYYGTPYDPQSFSSLMVACRYPSVYQRLTEDVSDLAQYGLDEASDPVYYEITDKSGDSYKVYIGDLSPTGNLYYSRVEGSDAVYISSTDVEYLFWVKESYVVPYLALPVPETEYYSIQNFSLKKDGNTVIDIKFMSDEEQQQSGLESYYMMNYPKPGPDANYPVNSSNYDEVLKTFVSFMGTQTVAFVNASDTMPQELLAQYGLDKDSYRYEMNYTYDGATNTVLISDIQNETETVIDEETGEETVVETGEKFYYAYSLLFQSVVKVSTDTLKFLEWDTLLYIDRPLLSHLNINDLKSVAIKGRNVDELFTLKGEDDDITVDVQSTGITLNTDETVNFRKFYVKLLSLSIEDYSDSRETDNLMMTMVVTTKSGKVTEYKFYATTASHCYYTINGEGEFYVLKRKVQKIMDDTLVLAERGEINSETN